MENKQEKKKRKRIGHWGVYGITFGAVIVLWVSYFILPIIPYNPLDFSRPEKASELGDMFGSLNTLFSGLAFAGLIITLIYQRQELQLQRKELRMQRREMVAQKKEMEGQKEEMRLQRKQFELQDNNQVFFNLKKSHENLKDRTSRFLFEQEISLKRFLSENLNYDSSIQNLDELVLFYSSNIYEFNQDMLEVNFRSLQNIMSFIDKSITLFSLEKAQEYFKILSTCWSKFEMDHMICIILIQKDSEYEIWKERITRYQMINYVNHPKLKKLLTAHFEETAS